jgi:hypothetical protein
MDGLSLRPVRIALLAALALAGVVAPAAAQMPIQAPPAPVGSESTDAVTAPPAPAEAALAEPPLPPAPSPPPATPDGTDASVASRAPAKAALLTERAVAPELAAREEEDDGNDLGPRRTWYGWQTLSVDGASLGLALVSSAIYSSRGSSNDASAALGLAAGLGFSFGSGIVHFVHRNPGRGFASFGLRLGMPIAGAIVGAAVTSGCDGYLCEKDGTGIGALIGAGGAVALDAALFAYDDRKPVPREATLSPLFVLTPGRALLGVGGVL